MKSYPDPWSHLKAEAHEWLFSEDSYVKAIEKQEPERIFNNCAYVGVKEKQPVYGLSADKKPMGFQDISLFTSVEGKDFEIAKRLVDEEGKGKWEINDWFTLKIMGCCNIIGIKKE